ncbi:MAG: LysR family transcriptional regulator [Verrucomicrobiaceae bacterium]|nr:MAG: LysR family transcriptional regulator [Verrucomicrobiaceae bacterium]
MNSPASPPLDLRELHLVRLVASQGGMTAAAKTAGLSQSALTRQIQLIEARLGVRLFDRTTRRVVLTPAGALLLKETQAVPGILESAMRRLREEVLGATREIRVGFSRSVCLAHLPGLLHGHVKRHPEVRTSISHLAASALIESIASGRLDVAILAPPARLPDSVEILHRIEDRFVIVAPAGRQVPEALEDPDGWKAWAASQAWIVPPSGTRSRACIDDWWRAQEIVTSAAMELDSFDTAIHLVALGLGTACVPRRALSTFTRKKRLKRVNPPHPLTRELVVIAPKRESMPAHVREFVESILF